MSNHADPDQKPTDLDLHCLLVLGISGLRKTRVNGTGYLWYSLHHYYKGYKDYPKYSNTTSPYHTSPNIRTNPFNYQLTGLETAGWVTNNLDLDQISVRLSTK